MTKQRKVAGLSGTKNEKIILSHQQIEGALFYLEDLLERAQIPFILLEGLARQVHDGVPYFSLNEINVGVEEKYLKETGQGFLKIVAPELYIDDNVISFEKGGVPITIWIIHKKWKFFQNPDTKFYGITEFKLPNPFEKYWRSRFLIK